MNDLYRISFVTDPDGRVLLADIDLVEPEIVFDVKGYDERSHLGLDHDGIYGTYLIREVTDDE